MRTDLTPKNAKYVVDACGDVVAALIAVPALRRASQFISPGFVMKATRQRKFDGRDTRATFIVTVGRPNFAEKKFIKSLIEAKEPFPVKHVQFTYWPKKRAA